MPTSALRLARARRFRFAGTTGRAVACAASPVLGASPDDLEVIVSEPTQPLKRLAVQNRGQAWHVTGETVIDCAPVARGSCALAVVDDTVACADLVATTFFRLGADGCTPLGGDCSDLCGSIAVCGVRTAALAVDATRALSEYVRPALSTRDSSLVTFFVVDPSHTLLCVDVDHREACAAVVRKLDAPPTDIAVCAPVGVLVTTHRYSAEIRLYDLCVPQCPLVRHTPVPAFVPACCDYLCV